MKAGIKRWVRPMLSFYLLLAVGFLVGIALLSLIEVGGDSFSFAGIWHIDFLCWFLVAPVIMAAVGPLGITSLMAYLFRVEGGTLLARSLIFSSVLIYLVLVLIICKWVRAESKGVRWTMGLLLVAYSVLATVSLLYVSSRM